MKPKKAPHPAELEPIRLNAIRHLNEATEHLTRQTWHSAAFSACCAIEEAAKYAHLRWGIGGPQAVIGGKAHDARGEIAATIVNYADTSAAQRLTKSDPPSLSIYTGDPTALVTRVEYRRGELQRLGLSGKAQDELKRLGGGKAPARLKAIKHFRERALYTEKQKDGTWLSPVQRILPELAKVLAADATRVLAKLQLQG